MSNFAVILAHSPTKQISKGKLKIHMTVREKKGSSLLRQHPINSLHVSTFRIICVPLLLGYHRLYHHQFTNTAPLIATTRKFNVFWLRYFLRNFLCFLVPESGRNRSIIYLFFHQNDFIFLLLNYSVCCRFRFRCNYLGFLFFCFCF